jgi:hypothetical protein
MYSELQHTPGWTDLDIFKITYDKYMAFSRQYMAGQIILNPLSLAPNSYASSTDPVALFTNSIKQEPKDFPVIKSLNQWDSVKRAVNATATVQSIAEVLNHTYIPSAGDKPLFNLKNSYWYKVLVDIIQESSLQAIVNAGPVGDGQTVWLVFHCNRSLPTSPLPRFKMALGGVQTLHILTTGTSRCASLWNIPRRHL